MSNGKSDKIIIDNIDDRYSRLRLIPWWDQDKLKATKVIVVGAGALGNEILKNLALLGVGNIIVVDMDRIENSNLSRSILYREKDEGRNKAQVAAESVIEINPDCNVKWLDANIIYDVGLGIFRLADIVFGGLDNREARLSINQACWKMGVSWIDGSIEAMFGTVKVFVPPDTACYECTMNEEDFRLLNLRRSCKLLTRNEMLEGKVPTTPTLASIIAGIQVHEALKLIHKRDSLPSLAGKGLFFNGLTHDSYIINYDKKDLCLSHENYSAIYELPFGIKTTTLFEVLNYIRNIMGSEANIELEKEMIYALKCENCSKQVDIFRSLGQVSEDEAYCEDCNELMMPEMTHTIYGSEPYINQTLESVGIPMMEIFTGRNGNKTGYFELTGDRKYYT